MQERGSIHDRHRAPHRYSTVQCAVAAMVLVTVHTVERRPGVTLFRSTNKYTRLQPCVHTTQRTAHPQNIQYKHTQPGPPQRSRPNERAASHTAFNIPDGAAEPPSRATRAHRHDTVYTTPAARPGSTSSSCHPSCRRPCRPFWPSSRRARAAPAAASAGTARRTRRRRCRRCARRTGRAPRGRPGRAALTRRTQAEEHRVGSKTLIAGAAHGTCK